MNNFALEIWYDEGSACTIYTVKWLDSQTSETDSFFKDYGEKKKELKPRTEELLVLVINSIAGKYGATDDFINRNKQKADALPPKPNQRIEEIQMLGINFPLRLYCYRISEEILVLFNGGEKTAGTDQESPDLRTKFYEAQRFASRIEEALRDGMIEITNEKRLVDFQQNQEIIL